MTITIGDPCPDCGVPTMDYNGMAVCADCYERTCDPLFGQTISVKQWFRGMRALLFRQSFSINVTIYFRDAQRADYHVLTPPVHIHGLPELRKLVDTCAAPMHVEDAIRRQLNGWYDWSYLSREDIEAHHARLPKGVAD